MCSYSLFLLINEMVTTKFCKKKKKITKDRNLRAPENLNTVNCDLESVPSSSTSKDCPTEQSVTNGEKLSPVKKKQEISYKVCNMQT